MNARRLILSCTAILYLAFGAAARADELLMARAQLAFPEAIAALQDAIEAHGYTVSHIQRVDVGLTVGGGFKTAEYRIVFFAKAREMAELPARVPELAAYLPLKIAIFAEGDTTLLTTNNPQTLQEFFPQAGLDAVFSRWHDDVSAIFDTMRRAD